jgi:hypothetical protein
MARLANIASLRRIALALAAQVNLLYDVFIAKQDLGDTMG